MPQRQAGDQILRLHAQHSVFVHRQNEINGLASRFVRAILEMKPIKRGDALAFARFDRFTAPKTVADFRAFSVKADIPGELRVFHLGKRLDIGHHAEKVLCPNRDHLAERRLPALVCAEIERHIELIAAAEIMSGIPLAQNVDCG
jgi:hypothetical protein